MPDHPIIVQFLHPGREYKVAERNSKPPFKCPWVINKSKDGCGSRCGSHTRRCVAHTGAYVDKDGSLKKTRLTFWTEWEACSIAERLNSSVQNNGFDATWIHTVLSPRNPPPNAQNTDPCVFGRSFKYCCCQQSRASLRALAPDSLILFGSRMDGRFFLDTVFVVDGAGIPYETGGKDRLNVSRQYRNLTLNRLSPGATFTFYRGRAFLSPDAPQMYSFTPAQIDDGRNAGKRFELKIGKVNTVFSRQAKRNVRQDLGRFFWKIPADPATIFDLWKKILDLVRADGFVPAVQFDWPR